MTLFGVGLTVGIVDKEGFIVGCSLGKYDNCGVGQALEEGIIDG